MRLVRNTTTDGTCKYALIRLDKIRSRGLMDELERLLGEYMHTDDEGVALRDFVELGLPNSEDEFFVIKLKDINAPVALQAYAGSAYDNGDPFFASDVEELQQRSGSSHPCCKLPD